MRTGLKCEKGNQMPELPEVELVARTLGKLVKGRRIVTSEILRPRLIPHHTPKAFTKVVTDTLIKDVSRRGKHILIHLDNDHSVMVHLRMAGRFMLLSEERDDPKFTHAKFHLDDENKLVFSDQRHFGFMRLYKTEALPDAKELRDLAPEPFSKEFTEEYFLETISSSRRNLKEFLLDQSKVLGLGNIYACETMFLSGVDPRSRACDVTKPIAKRLFETMREVLKESIEFSKRMKIDPENIDGSYFGGAHDNHWFVYDREQEPCVKCTRPIKRIPQGSRSTYFCWNCQRMMRPKKA